MGPFSPLYISVAHFFKMLCKRHSFTANGILVYRNNQCCVMHYLFLIIHIFSEVYHNFAAKAVVVFRIVFLQNTVICSPLPGLVGKVNRSDAERFGEFQMKPFTPQVLSVACPLSVVV